MNSVKQIDIKNRRYYFYDSMTNIKNLDPSKSKINEKSYKNIVIYYIGYVTVKDFSYAEIISVKSLYLIINKVNGYIEEINESK